MALQPPRPPKSVIAPPVRRPVRPVQELPTPAEVADVRKAKAKAAKASHKRAEAIAKLPAKDIPAQSPKDLAAALELAKRVKRTHAPPKKDPKSKKVKRIVPSAPLKTKRNDAHPRWKEACVAAGASPDAPPLSGYRGASPLYRPEFCAYIVDLASDYDMIPVEIAAHLGISEHTYKHWVREYAEFAQAHQYVMTLLKAKYMRGALKHANADTGSATLLKWLGGVGLGLTEEQTIKHANPDGTKLEGIRVEFVTASPHPDLPENI